MARGMSEAQHQAAVIKWTQQPAIRSQWPELALLHHIPNGGTRDPVEAKHLKQQGVKNGVPDLCLPVPRGRYHGLYIEMKRRTGLPALIRNGGARSCGNLDMPGLSAKATRRPSPFSSGTWLCRRWWHHERDF